MGKSWMKRGMSVGALALIPLAGLVLVLLRPPDDPFQGSAVTNPPFSSLTYSVQAFLWWDPGVASVHLDWVRMMGFSHVKQIFAWEDLEPEPGRWEFSYPDRILDDVEARGLRLIVRLSDVPDWAHPSIPGRKDEDFIDGPPDPAFIDDWASYCGTIAGRYRGRIAAYQIWNEPNLDREWGNRTPNAAEYVELLRVCSEAVRAADPTAVLISAGPAPTGSHDSRVHRDDIYLNDMYQAGFQRYVDVVGMHAPGYAPPALGPDDAERQTPPRGRWATFRRIEDLRKIMIANGDAARQVAILEFGWTTDQRPGSPYAWFAVDADQQAQYIVEAYQYAAEHWRPWVGLMSLIYMANPAWTDADEETYWAITVNNPANIGGFVRPAFFYLIGMDKVCGSQTVRGIPFGTPPPDSALDYPMCAP